MTTVTTIRPGGRMRRLGRALAYGIVVAVLVTGIALLIRAKFDPLLQADESAITSATAVTRARPWLLNTLLTWQTLSQPTVVYVVATLVCLWVWLRRGLKTRAWWAFLTMMVGWNVALDLKYVVQRARPVVEDAVAHAPGYSFPSGHAANAAIGSTTLVVLLWPFLKGRLARGVAVALAASFTLLTCLDRVFLGVHYPSDVTAGVLLGVGLVLASYAGYLGWSPPTPSGSSTPSTPSTGKGAS